MRGIRLRWDLSARGEIGLLEIRRIKLLRCLAVFGDMRPLRSSGMGSVRRLIPGISRHPDMQGISRMIGRFCGPAGTFNLGTSGVRAAQAEMGRDLAVCREDEISPLTSAEMPGFTATELCPLIRHVMPHCAKRETQHLATDCYRSHPEPGNRDLAGCHPAAVQHSRGREGQLSRLDRLREAVTAAGMESIPGQSGD